MTVANQAKKITIGLMPGGIDGLVLADKYVGRGIGFKYLIPQNKEEANWAKKFLPHRDLIFYDLVNANLSMAKLDFSGIVKNSNLFKKIRLNKITHLLIHHAVDSDLEKWANQNNLNLIAPNFQLAQKLENKIWFNNFMAKNNLPTPMSEIWRPDAGKWLIKSKVVVQEPHSRGGEGTYFINSLAEVKKLLRLKKIKSNKKYLVRQFIKGSSYGITIFINHNTIALSALRVQCYDGKNKWGQKEFRGVQWLGSRILSSQLRQKIDQVFYLLGKNLRQLGYVGYANIDFLISNSKIYILECNPRFAASTAQLLLFPENISGINTAKLYLDSLLFATKSKNFKFFGFPKSNFNGSTLYISTEAEKTSIKNYYPAGGYRLIGNKIRFVGPDLTRLNRQARSFIFYSDTQPGEVLKSATVVGLVIANFPLYDSRGKLNKYGKMMIEYFRY